MRGRPSSGGVGSSRPARAQHSRTPARRRLRATTASGVRSTCRCKTAARTEAKRSCPRSVKGQQSRGRSPVAPAYGMSPFPPIGEYGFLSDCEVTALVAPSGNVEWLCLPRFDSPSVFGAILDRDAGGFRFGPSDVRVPAARRYLPGTMILETSWGSANGWMIVRDVLLIGPWRHERDRSHTQRRAPTDYDAEHSLLRMVRCVNGEVQLTLDCEPVFDYGRHLGRWEYTEAGYHQGDCRPTGPHVCDSPVLTLTSDINIGFEGPRAVGRTLIKEGETRFCALSWGGREPPRTYEEAYRRLVWTAHHWQHWLARGRFPDHPVALVPRAIRADAEGADVRADGRRRRRSDDVPAGDARRRAELGLPLLLDPRLDVRAVGPLHARLRLGGARLPLLRGRDGGRRARSAGDVRRRWRAATRREDPRAPRRLRGRASPSGSATRRTGSASTTSGARCWTRSICTRPATASTNGSGRSSSARSRRPSSIGGARPRHLGGPRRAAALHLVQGDVLGRRRPGRATGAPSWRRRRRRSVARPPDEIKADILAHGARRARRLHAVVRLDGARRIRAADAAAGIPAARGRADPRDGPRDRGRADRRRPGAALPAGGDRRRPAQPGGLVHDLLVLARVGVRRDRRAAAGSASCARSCSRMRARWASTARSWIPGPAGTSATSRRRSRTSR